MFLEGIVCKTSVALDAQRAVHNCIQTPTFSYAELALQLFGLPVGAQPRTVVCGSGSRPSPKQSADEDAVKPGCGGSSALRFLAEHLNLQTLSRVAPQS